MHQLLSKSCLLFLGVTLALSGIPTGTRSAMAQPSPAVAASELPPTSELPVRPAVVQQEQPMPPKRHVLVMIDPGHGGKDSGAIGINGLREVDVILPIALRVAEILTKNGVTAQLTRDKDYFVGLDERVQMSTQAGANIFVSIHANSIDNRPDVHGLETYHYKIGEELAKTVHQRIVSFFNIDQKISLADRNVRSARFLVLRKSSIPAILVETGYLTSPEESEQLGKADYQEKMAQGIAQGILEYLSKSGSLPQEQRHG